MSSPSEQRTLAILFAPECEQYLARARQVLSDGGLRVASEAVLSGQDLKEAGVDLAAGVGEGGEEAAVQENELKHAVLVLEGQEAVDRLKELQASSLANACPDLRVIAARSASAAVTLIDSLFPSLLAPPQTPSTAAFPSSTLTGAEPKPFALSNLAFHETQKRSSPTSSERILSPSIEKALEELEEREERRRKSSAGSRSTKTSLSTPRNASRLSGIAATAAEDGFVRDEEVVERRVFTAHSREPSEDYDYNAAEGEEGGQQEDEEADALFPEGRSTPATQLFANDLDSASELSYVQSSSVLSAPALSRVESNVSSTSASSSTPSTTSFRARPAPPSTARPALQPRLSKAAALRLGVPLSPTTPRRSVSEASSSAEAIPPTVPRAVPTPKSLAAPAIAPRMTKSASLCGGQDAPSDAKSPRPTKRQSISTAERAAMDRLARRHSDHVPSVAATPAVEVRLSRAAMLRQGIQPPPTAPRPARQSSAMSAEEGKPASASSSSAASTTAKRMNVSANLKALREPTVAPRSTRASAMRTGGGSVTLESPSMARGKSLGTVEGSVAQQQGPGSVRAKQLVNFEGVPGHKRRESIQVKATQAPKVEVKMSRAARLRNGIIVEEEKGGSTPMRRVRTEPLPNMYESVPGQTRRTSLAVASTKAPSITPRLNRAVLLRQTSEDRPSSSSAIFRRPASSLASTTTVGSSSSSSLTVPLVTAAPRAPSAQSVSRSAAPAIAPRLNKAAELRAAKKVAAAGEMPMRRKVVTASGKGSRPSSVAAMALRETTNSPGLKKADEG
ncbi:hypothetical protein JCM11251_005209 [Rhodosporidiobolus azoricus]